jgi:3',5'-cyclic-AMP phosphodiesterase
LVAEDMFRLRTLYPIPTSTRSFLCGLFLLFLLGCGKLFDVTPYDATPPDDLRDLTAVNKAAIEAQLQGHSGAFTFALLSDPHYHYSDLKDVVAHMRTDPTIRFVLVPGDLADQGLLAEFEWFARGMQDLDVPWLALIGNHDHLGNGRAIYEAMFGPRNFTMDLPGYRFVFFDDTVWESNMAPDFAWLDGALAGAGDRSPIVVTHIPPWTDQLVGVYEEPMRQRLANAAVPLFIYGHLHRFNDHQPYGDGVRYLCVPWPQDRSYAKVMLGGPEIVIQHVRL